MFNDIVIIRGGGDLASGTIQKLHRSGFRVLVLEVAKPTAIRRSVSFSEAVYEREVKIEGIIAAHVCSLSEVENAWSNKKIPVIIDEEGKYIQKIKPKIVVDAIIAKKNMGTTKDMADITIAIGPGFTAGKDVDVVIETTRGHNLGRLIFHGQAAKNTGIPGNIMGYSKERVIHSTCAGIIKNVLDIGAVVEKDEVIAYIGENQIKATISGLLRGILRSGSTVKEGFKIADIDPRVSEKMNCYTISDKARNIAGGVLEAVLYLTTFQKEG
ncbi:EF2563 family selenium-dependent molybdenum hydroxylase system protein [Clostridium estertheticum]|uniref:selenium-dependent molybdenum cofactor biosynthesis protein YqeB n=1 Tax=Clostridium estertheticum TaxID=238834 RepID=UPI0013EE7200|nr:selenium-dependent molybdenum cofactor biosynthesis protein YqeB [Clostridium estertheticum]MBZ9606777.1 EF2563 family selenium-dependent molybdenum hydroxylase system protein [Clostridium estertheticum]